MGKTVLSVRYPMSLKKYLIIDDVIQPNITTQYHVIQPNITTQYP